jgi:hypothetical protein
MASRMPRWKQVDDALIWMVGKGKTQFTRKDLAARIGITDDEASGWLQIHRRAQAKGVTQVVVYSKGAGRSSTWHVNYRPGRQTVEMNNHKVGALTWNIRDHFDRLVTAIVCEVDPALQGNSHLSQAIEDVADLLFDEIDRVVRRVAREAVAEGLLTQDEAKAALDGSNP